MEFINVANIEFSHLGKIYSYQIGNNDVRVGDQVVVETERGMSIARIVELKYLSADFFKDKKIKSIIRKASPKDLLPPKKIGVEDAFVSTRAKINELNLKMKLLKVEIQFGGNKVLIFFSAPGRVDFRELVKQLASSLKARVELKQVGARDEAKLLGGMGRCGREYCCSTFLREFVPVSIKMAKIQNLALNPTKVSGGCGRLLCCLTYENETYQEMRKGLPAIGSRIRVVNDNILGLIVKVDVLNQRLLIETEHGKMTEVKLEDVEIVSRAKEADVSDDGQWGEDIDLGSLE